MFLEGYKNADLPKLDRTVCISCIGGVKEIYREFLEIYGGKLNSTFNRSKWITDE